DEARDYLAQIKGPGGTLPDAQRVAAAEARVGELSKKVGDAQLQLQSITNDVNAAVQADTDRLQTLREACASGQRQVDAMTEREEQLVNQQVQLITKVANEANIEKEIEQARNMAQKAEENIAGAGDAATKDLQGQLADARRLQQEAQNAASNAEAYLNG